MKKKCSWWGFICFTPLNFVLRFESWTTCWMNSALWEYYFYMALQSVDLQVTCHYWARVAQWWEHSPSTHVARVQILASTPYVGWVCCWFSPLTKRFLSGYPSFPLSLKTITYLFFSIVLYFIALCNVLCGIVLYCTVIVFIFCRYFQTQIEAVLMAITRNIVTLIKKDANEEVYLYIKMFRCYDE